MDNWRVTEELDKMKEWDPDAVVDALNLSSEELVDKFVYRALEWIEDNCE